MWVALIMYLVVVYTALEKQPVKRVPLLLAAGFQQTMTLNKMKSAEKG